MTNCIPAPNLVARFSSELDKLVARARESPCPVCGPLAALLANTVCLPVLLPFDEARRRFLLAVLHLVDNDRSRAAAMLGVTRGTIYQWCEQYGVPLRRTPRPAGNVSLQGHVRGPMPHTR